MTPEEMRQFYVFFAVWLAVTGTVSVLFLILVGKIMTQLKRIADHGTKIVWHLKLIREEQTRAIAIYTKRGETP